VTIVASDGSLADSETVTITVNDTGNLPPVLAPIGDKSTSENQPLAFALFATDPNLTVPSLSAADLPAGAALVDSLNGRGFFAWTPDYFQSGMHHVTFIASDGFLADSEMVMITVDNVNRAPVIVPPAPQTMRGGETLAVVIAHHDPDFDPISCWAVGLKPHIVLVESGSDQHSLIFTPGRFYINTDTAAVIVSDGALADTALAVVTIQGQAKGDFNFDLLLSPADVVLGLNCVFLGTGDCPLAAADVNCDSGLSPADIVLLLNAVFLGLPFPC
jgi:hypothetical protein